MYEALSRQIDNKAICVQNIAPFLRITMSVDRKKIGQKRTNDQRIHVCPKSTIVSKEYNCVQRVQSCFGHFVCTVFVHDATYKQRSCQKKGISLIAPEMTRTVSEPKCTDCRRIVLRILKSGFFSSKTMEFFNLFLEHQCHVFL